MGKVTGIETHVVLPLSTYKRLTQNLTDAEQTQREKNEMTENKNKLPVELSTTTTTLEEENQIPEDIKLLLCCVPVKHEKSCLLVLQHLSRLNGSCAVHPNTGELVLDKQQLLCGSNMPEILRILFSTPRNGATGRSVQMEEQMGTCVLANILAQCTPLPISIITNPYWRSYT